MPGNFHPKHEFDAYAHRYEHELDNTFRRLVDPHGQYFIKAKFDEILSCLSARGLHLNQLTLADIGCGIGDLEKHLIPNTRRIIACDISIEMLKVARQLYPLPSGGYISSDARSISLPSSCTDVVVSSCLFHHLQPSDLLPCLSEMKRICRPGGLVICFEHNPLNLLTQLVVRLTPLDKTARLIHHSIMRAAFKSAGLQVLDTRFILFGPKFIDARLGRIKNLLSRLRLGGQYYVVGQKSSS